MIESFLNSIRTRRNVTLWLDEPPEDEELGRRVAQALTSNVHITGIGFAPDDDGDKPASVIQWVTTSAAGETVTATLARFTNLEKIIVAVFSHDWSLEDWDLIFRLLLTSTSLQRLELNLRDHDGRVMSALSQYLGAATRSSLRTFEFDFGTFSPLVPTTGLSGADFVSLCDGVTRSQLRTLLLGANISINTDLEMAAAESLARAIAESSLEEVTLLRRSLLFRWNLFHTQPVRNLDFAINIGTVDRDTRMIINRKWKPLLSGNAVPLALWPRILEKAHVLPETSHGPAGILFHLLREKPDLVR
jgi:hypothetical protein